MDEDLKESTTAILTGMAICAGYLNCIFMQGQVGRPLKDEEKRFAINEAYGQVIAITYKLSEPGE